MPLTDPDLWNVIRTWPLPYRQEVDHDLSPPRTCSSFEHNLRKIGGWTDAAAEEITAEYRKFLYLKAIDGGVLTPPDEIDRAWHLHQGFAADYSDRFCRQTLGKPLSHVTDLTFRQRLAAHELLLDRYQAEFDSTPPADIWPDSTALANDRTAGWLLAGAAVCGAVGALSGELVAKPGFALFLPALIFLMLAAGFYFRKRPGTIASCG